MELNTIFFINLAVIVILIICIISGWIKGFLWKLISLASFFLVGFFAWWLSSPLSKIISLYPKDQLPFQETMLSSTIYDTANRLLIFIILFFLLEIILLVIRPIIKLLQEIPVLSFFNKVAGSILGFLEGMLFLAIITFLLCLPIFSDGTQWVNQSYLRYSEPLVNTLLTYTNDTWELIDMIRQGSEDVTALTPEQIENIRIWLQEHQIDKENIDAIIGSLKSE